MYVTTEVSNNLLKSRAILSKVQWNDIEIMRLDKNSKQSRSKNNVLVNFRAIMHRGVKMRAWYPAESIVIIQGLDVFTTAKWNIIVYVWCHWHGRSSVWRQCDVVWTGTWLHSGLKPLFTAWIGQELPNNTWYLINLILGLNRPGSLYICSWISELEQLDNFDHW